jgi:hypothetical protein
MLHVIHGFSCDEWAARLDAILEPLRWRNWPDEKPQPKCFTVYELLRRDKDGLFVWLGCLDGNDWCDCWPDSEGETLTDVVGWRPLPEPPGQGDLTEMPICASVKNDDD